MITTTSALVGAFIQSFIVAGGTFFTVLAGALATLDGGEAAVTAAIAAGGSFFFTMGASLGVKTPGPNTQTLTYSGPAPVQGEGKPGTPGG